MPIRSMVSLVQYHVFLAKSLLNAQLHSVVELSNIPTGVKMGK